MNAQRESALEYVMQYVLPLLSLVISLVALFLVFGQGAKIEVATEMAKEGNLIAKEAKELVKPQNTIPVDGDESSLSEGSGQTRNLASQNRVSAESVEEVYAEIYENEDYTEIIYNYLKPKASMENSQELRDFMLVFEGVGNGYCDGLLSDSEILSYLGRTLSLVCTNEDIATYFPQGNNGVAILCDQFVSGSRYAQKLVPDSLDECAFVAE